MVVEELREALVHLGHPELQNILSARERVAGVLDVERVLGVVVDVRVGYVFETPTSITR